MIAYAALFVTGLGCKLGFQHSTLAGTLVRLSVLLLAFCATVWATAQLTLHCFTVLQHHA